MQIPHDLVTVIREPAARVLLHQSLGVYPGRRRWALIFQPGNLPAAGYGGKRPRSRGIGCTVKNLLKARGLLCCHSACKRPRFLVGLFWCTPFCVCGRPALYRPSVIIRKEAGYMRRINWKKPAAVAAALALSTALLAGWWSPHRETNSKRVLLRGKG